MVDSKKWDVLIKEYLEKNMDEEMLNIGYKRRKTSLKYERNLDGTVQFIEIIRYYNPSYKKDSDVHIYPMVQIKNSNISSIALDMVENAELLSNSPEVILRQPIDSLAPKENRNQWYACGEEQLISILKEMKAFVLEWVTVFLKQYSSAEGIVKGFKENDSRPANTERWYIYVAASYCYLGDLNAALNVLEEKFNSLGKKKRYFKAFNYLEIRLKTT
ncbi:hypothetical protein BBD42_14330 [Paenibacillus sp. BIHB 4019]|uniref:Uncharacterized protein n=1 Tax=Paenibacillus sp. BIHB 4019 TaxID=1870819 RepID=A0A1B2DIJ7_9BACL|nr:hypothetical protein [Paenibacillus sp. BIHB 4019]ANY67519.1 hypothetical protein BBD42_14330 [Paenibacillus sp. BIHB 4019]